MASFKIRRVHPGVVANISARHLPGGRAIHQHRFTYSTLDSRLPCQDCILKRYDHCYLRPVCSQVLTQTAGVAFENLGNLKDAAHNYQSILKYLTQTQSTVGTTIESDHWTESLLSRYCALVDRHMRSHLKNPHALLTSAYMPASHILDPYRLWSAYKQDRQSKRSFGAVTVWKAYFDDLSILLQHHILNPIFPSRSHQKTELQKVQAIYETLLIRDNNFPHANQVNVEIESWVEQVMANWKTMLCPPWQETDLSPGGKIALGKSVLEILYRAATKTFHSTRILRHLFTVHTSLADFALAGKALNTYLEIVAKGKARVEKSGEKEIGLDDDATALCTASAGIKTLCLYGGREETEKALDIANKLEIWLRKAMPQAQDAPEVSSQGEKSKTADGPRNKVSESSVKAIALAHHALGISRSYWARLTHETSSRSDLQNQAIRSFKDALQLDLDDGTNLEILCSLAYALAETRQIDAAIKIAKSAVSIGYGDDDSETEGKLDPYQRDTVLKCWHLLVLLLTARQNYAAAVASCEAAFDVYGGKSIIKGDSASIMKMRSLRLSERRGLIELKMTQLALSEVIDGPEEAVNASGELLGLYAKLFTSSEKNGLTVPETKPASPAASLTGTQRSFRGSLLGHPKDRKSHLQTDGMASSSAGSLEPLSEVAGGPAIAITSEDIILPQNPNHHHHFLGRHESNKLRKRNSRKTIGSQRRSRTRSPSKQASSDGDGHLLPGAYNPRTSLDESGAVSQPSAASSANPSYTTDDVGVALTHDHPSHPATPAAASDPPNPMHHISSAAQIMAKNPNPHPIAPKPSTSTPYPQSISITPQTTTLTSNIPEPCFPPSLSNRHAQTLLIKIWLQIASLYRRASLFSDATAAIGEATSAVQSLESSIATLEGSSEANFTALPLGGCGLKALGELWADVLAESGALHLSSGETQKADASFEAALGWWPDHPAAIIGLANRLLDSYEKACQQSSSSSSPPPPHPPPTSSATSSTDPASEQLPSTPPPALEPPRQQPTLASPFLPSPSSTSPFANANAPADSSAASIKRRPSLTALSARDRSYSLLSMLTKSGQGWADSGAWYALARAYECSGMPEKAVESLWWVVELEGGRGVRDWSAAGF